MSDVFRSYLWKFVLEFFDDMLNYCKDQEHQVHLEKVLIPEIIRPTSVICQLEEV